MDAAMELVEDGKRLVSEGESNIKDAHRNVCSALTRLFGGTYDLGSPRDIRARCRSAAKSGVTPEVSPFFLLFSFFASLLFLLYFFSNQRLSVILSSVIHVVSNSLFCFDILIFF
jgi:hypothetical protein